MNVDKYFKRNKHIYWCWVTDNNLVINEGDWISTTIYNDKHFSKKITNSVKVSPVPKKVINPYYLKYTLFEMFVNYIKLKL